MLYLNLRPVFDLRGIENPYSFLVKAGFSSYNAHKLLNTRNYTFQLLHIEKLCRILACTPNDLLCWVPASDDLISETHPLQELRSRIMAGNWKKTMKTIPLSQLRELAKMIEDQKGK
ncbi:MAG: hypothetical protein K0S33_1896 [Bacteroidetes bacterium]|jgi:DNA-binding Xre family transcriptional regulator|nr:hypothetical protein [Bacteroidota bacterium]